MDYTRTVPTQREERNGPDDEALLRALAAHARGSFEAIRGIATMRNVGWQDAANAYPEIFLAEVQAVMERIANAKMRGGR